MSVTIDHQPLQITPLRYLDLESGDALEALVVPLLEAGTEVVADLSEVTFADSSGIGALIAIHQAATDRGARFVLAAPSRHVRQLLEMTGLTDFFTIADG